MHVHENDRRGMFVLMMMIVVMRCVLRVYVNGHVHGKVMMMMFVLVVSHSHVRDGDDQSHQRAISLFTVFHIPSKSVPQILLPIRST